MILKLNHGVSMDDNTDAIISFINMIQAILCPEVTLHIPANSFMPKSLNRILYLEDLSQLVEYSEDVSIYNDPDSFTPEVLDYIETCGFKLGETPLLEETTQEQPDIGDDER